MVEVVVVIVVEMVVVVVVMVALVALVKVMVMVMVMVVMVLMLMIIVVVVVVVMRMMIIAVPKNWSVIRDFGLLIRLLLGMWSVFGVFPPQSLLLGSNSKSTTSRSTNVSVGLSEIIRFNTYSAPSDRICDYITNPGYFWTISNFLII